MRQRHLMALNPDTTIGPYTVSAKIGIERWIGTRDARKDEELLMANYSLSGTKAILLGAALVLVLAPVALGQDRMPPILTSEMTDAQAKVAAEFEAERGYALRGPWVPLLRSPQVLRLMLDMRSHVRDRSLLSPQAHRVGDSHRGARVDATV